MMKGSFSVLLFGASAHSLCQNERRQCGEHSVGICGRRRTCTKPSSGTGPGTTITTMKKRKSGSKKGKGGDSPTQPIDARIKELSDWRGVTLGPFNSSLEATPGVP